MPHRQLTSDEIAVMRERECRAEDWSRVRVTPRFTPGDSYRRVNFSGDVVLGGNVGSVAFPEGFSLPGGIEDASLHNVRIGDGCLIRSACIANADIGDGCLIQNVGVLSCDGESTFANGSPVAVLAEDGARSVPLSRRLSAQIAHLVCHLKGAPAARALEDLLRRDAESLAGSRSYVSPGCRIRNVLRLANVWIGEGSEIEGASSLENCCLDGAAQAPVRIGEGVAADDCVFLAASHVSGGVRLKHCLVGEGVELDNAFSGKHSLIFANSEFALGEAACAMAGPFAVSHHRATLVLTCQCSFNTFGSAANSSNHHFKLGPRHGGVLRRGTRCGSGSYIFWPSDIGAFSSVVGRHSVHLDTAVFPFSLIVAKGDASILVPGVNLFTSGMFRDAQKWRDRDRRVGVDRPSDLINPAILSPYTLQAVEAGIELIEQVQPGANLHFGGATIPASRFEPALRIYRMAIVFHMGKRLLARAVEHLGGGAPTADEVLRVIDDATSGPDDPSEGRWRDWGGMLLPGVQADAIVAELAEGRFTTIEAFQRRLEEVHARYGEYELAWLAWRWKRRYGEPGVADVASFFADWREAVRFRHQCFVKDAAKEFNHDAMLGFGVESDKLESFLRVRGSVEEHPLAARAEAERESLLGMADNIRA